MTDIITFIQDMIVNVTLIAWIMFLLTWVIGWALKGAPIPFLRVKKAGQKFVEDAVWAAFWLAMGTTVFAIIAYVVSQFQQPFPQPPTI